LNFERVCRFSSFFCQGIDAPISKASRNPERKNWRQNFSPGFQMSLSALAHFNGGSASMRRKFFCGVIPRYIADRGKHAKL
jgi:hypothetical protein